MSKHKGQGRKTATQLRASKSGMFGDRPTCDKALEFAQSMFPPEQSMAVLTAVMVYHNTLLEVLAKDAESQADNLKSAITS